MIAMDGRHITCATMLTFAFLIIGTTEAQVFNDAVGRGASHVFTDLSTPYQTTAYSNLPQQEQVQAVAPQAETNPQPCAGDYFCQCRHCCQQKGLMERTQLTGDWGGRRNALAERGVVVDSSLTQFYQGVTSGGAEQTFRYGAKMDLILDFDTEKMGLWKGGNVFAHAVSWNFGQNSNADATFVAPVNGNLLYPTTEPSFAVSSLWYQQAIGDNGVALLMGRPETERFV
jgi:carbohydrate-selective porin OprB